MPLKVVPRRDRKLHRLVKRGEILFLKRGELLFRAGAPPGRLPAIRGHSRGWGPDYGPGRSWNNAPVPSPETGGRGFR